MLFVPGTYADYQTLLYLSASHANLSFDAVI